MNTPKPRVKLYGVDEMLARDGHYVMTTPLHFRKGIYAVCEVFAGVCYQLTPHGVRDGVLRREGWVPGVLLFDEDDLAGLIEANITTLDPEDE